MTVKPYPGAPHMSVVYMEGMNRAYPGMFPEADIANARKAEAHALESFRRAREARRLSLPLPAGSLFDEVTRAQTELFK